jgi:hypothetical protein
MKAFDGPLQFEADHLHEYIFESRVTKRGMKLFFSDFLNAVTS